MKRVPRFYVLNIGLRFELSYEANREDYYRFYVLNIGLRFEPLLKRGYQLVVRFLCPEDRTTF